jgi:hypothetical protein
MYFLFFPEVSDMKLVFALYPNTADISRYSSMGHHRHHNAIAILIVLIAMTTQDQYYDGQVGRGFSVWAFQPAPRRVSKIKPASSFTADPKASISEPSPATTSNTILLMAPGKKNKNDAEDDDTDISPVFWKDLGKKPGNLIILPFVALVGIDLLLNLIFITKRSIEFFVFGQAPSTDTWW